MGEQVVLEGLGKLHEGFKEWIDATDKAAKTIVRRGSIMISNAAKLQFRPRPGGSQRTSKRTGRVYYEGAPDFPANPPRPTFRSGNLQKSIRMIEIERLGFGRWQSATGPTMNYAPYVEFGTSRARQFPFLKMALDEVTPDLRALYEEEWAKAQRG